MGVRVDAFADEIGDVLFVTGDLASDIRDHADGGDDGSVGLGHVVLFSAGGEEEEGDK